MMSSGACRNCRDGVLSRYRVSIRCWL